MLVSALVDAPPLEFAEPPTPELLALEPSLLELEHAGTATEMAAQKRIDLFISLTPLSLRHESDSRLCHRGSLVSKRNWLR